MNSWRGTVKKSSLLLFLALGFSSLPNNVFADAGLGFSVNISDTPILEINLSDANGSAIGATTTMNVVPDHGTAAFNEKTMVVSVGTNNEWGYNLVMSVSNTSLISTEDGSKTIPTLTAKDGGYTCTVDTASSCDFTANTWGYKLNAATNLSAATNYLPLQSSINLNSNTSKVTTLESTSISFGSKVNATLAPGIYQTTINFAATANPDPTPVMQNVSASDLASLVPSDSNTTTLKDSRDNNKYQITNINGTYWMTDNLRFTGTNLTPADTNVTQNTTMTYFDLKSSTNRYDNALNSYTLAGIHYNTTDEDSFTYGAYYNYCAASAGTVCDNSTKQDATSDICPKGWRLPTQTEFTTIANNNGTNFNPVLAGMYSSGMLDFGGTPPGDWWWSATANTAIYQYGLIHFYDDSWEVYPHHTKDSGYSVRCVYDIPTMQSMTSSTLAEKIPNSGDTMTIRDERDNTTYTVGRLADGNVWMLDNLALDLTNSTTLNNTTASNTNASATTLNYLKGTSTGTTSDQYATAAVSNWTSDNSYSAPLVNATSKDQTQPLAAGQSGTGKVGVYYNYCAASAGSYCYGNGTSEGSPSGNATEDICPKGWRMPTGGSSGEYQALYTAYSSNNANFVNALKTPLSGTFYTGSAYDQGSFGYFWSSTYDSATGMYVLDIDASYVGPQDGSYRYSGYSIRCVYGPLPTMQNVDSAKLAQLMPTDGSTTTLPDSRDGNVYNIARIGNTYWMTDNLKIMGTISASESNFTGADFNISAGGDLTAGNTYTVPRAHFNNSTYGAYYNYCAASAGTVCNGATKQDATVDICPKGWRLPTQTEAQAFVGASSSNKNPVLAGQYSGGTLGYAGSNGFWWLATAYDTYAQHRLYYGGSSWGANYADRRYGYSVRCIAGS